MSADPPDPERGMAVLRLALSSIEQTAEPVSAAKYISKNRPIRDLAALEDALVHHLAAVEDGLAHIRRMRLYRERDTGGS